MIKHLNCDFCQKKFKRGYKIDLVVHRIFVRGGEVLWSYDDDVEYFADFCSKKCMRGFLDEWFYFRSDADGDGKLPESTDSSGDK